MVAIVLGILKLIGILILIVLGLVLAVIFSVLFVPVRYRAEGSCYESFKGKASVSWFFHLISLKAFYDGELHVDFRILWFHLGREKSEMKPEEKRRRKIPLKFQKEIQKKLWKRTWLVRMGIRKNKKVNLVRN